MLEGRYCVEESAFSALLELDEGDYPFQGLPKCSAPVTVLFSHFSGSAVDTTADYANAWGLTTIGTHTAGATGNLMVVPLCTGMLSLFPAHGRSPVMVLTSRTMVSSPESKCRFHWRRSGQDGMPVWSVRAAELEQMASGALAE